MAIGVSIATMKCQLKPQNNEKDNRTTVIYERTSQVSCAKKLTTICITKTLKFAQ